MNSLFDVEGKVAVVTGGYGVLGESMADCLANHGAKVAILGRDQKKAKQTALSLAEGGLSCMGLKADVLDQSQLFQARDRVLEEWGKVDILINAAGGNMPGATIGVDQTIFDLNIEDFRKVTQLNLDGTVLPSLVFGKCMAEQNSGTIINISSMTVQRAVTRVVGYSAAKAAIDNFTRWLAIEMAKKFGEGVRVNAIAPGFFITGQNKDLLTNPDGSLTSRGNDIIRNTPMGRFGEP
ncbi:MAG: SDR family NAD(P)-dependent oxidoreductase, partial [Bacteroidetes bacterium]|nr:SDR family NAD(P)-dependent oxidoreductase [Bacteroidota bacterium]